MKTIYVKYYSPETIGLPVEMLKVDSYIIKCCFRVVKYKYEAHALMAYAETPCDWSTLLDDSMSEDDVEEWIKEAYEHIKNHDYEWLEHNFV